MNLKHIRNFSIIAHIDHGKSTLADRLLDATHTIEKRKMRDQVLDRMDLERERGITIKMTPVRMDYTLNGESYILNLIDTPGHIDFSYEVSRALQAVEGSLLLVDSTQGVQAQTLTTLAMARDLGIKIIPVLTKIDSPISRVEDVKHEVMNLLDCEEKEILAVSGKTGEGVSELLKEIVERIPPPSDEYREKNNFRALVFDFEYSNHQGVIVYVRVLDGEIKKGDDLSFCEAKERFIASDVGVFTPEKKSAEKISAGEIGYIVTSIKKPGIASVGDTITLTKNPLPALPGYQNPRPVVWASLYPESQDDFDLLKESLVRLKLSDSSLSFEEEVSGSLGRGFRCGFLGMLHLEIVTERLRREFNLELIVTSPSINYEVVYQGGKREKIYSPHLFPRDGTYAEAFEPWASITLITPPDYVGGIMQLLYEHEAEVGESNIFGDNRVSIKADVPLRELMRNFFDELKSVSSGFASLSYDINEMRKADVTRLDIVVAEEVVPAFTRVISRRRAQEDAEKAVEKLHQILPRQLFEVKIQATALGRILSSRSLKALRKDVTGYLYGGDITRKMKLREKQKKGKKRMKAGGRVNIPKEVFLNMMKNQ